MYRWWLSSYSFVVYSPNSTTVSFNQNISSSPQQSRCRQRLSISWPQFLNLKDVIDVLTTNGNDLSTSIWNLENGLWLLLLRQRNRYHSVVRLQVNHSQYFPSRHYQQQHQQQQHLLFFDFEPRAWARYKNQVQQHIVNTHRFFATTTTTPTTAAVGGRNGDRCRRQWRPRWCNCERYSHCERHVRRRSSFKNRSSEDGTRIHYKEGDDLQTLSRATANATRLPSILASQYSDIPLRQNTSDGSTFSFRRTLNDHLRAASSTTTTSPIRHQQQQQCDGRTDGASSNDSELAEFSTRCSLNYACEIE